MIYKINRLLSNQHQRIVLSVSKIQKRHNKERFRNDLDEQSNNKLLLYIVVPMSFIVFVLSVLIIILLLKSNHRSQSNPRDKNKHPPSLSSTQTSNLYTNNFFHRSSPNKLFIERKTSPHVYPIHIDRSPQPVHYPSPTPSPAMMLPPLLSPMSSTMFPAPTIQPLSVRRLYKSYV